MQFQVTAIEFDFTVALWRGVVQEGNYELPEEEQKKIYDEILGSSWEADDGDHLVAEITAATGWCIKSIDYRIILN